MYQKSAPLGAIPIGRLSRSVMLPLLTMVAQVLTGLSLSGCQKNRETVIDLGEGFEVIHVEDPDPEKDRQLPKQCNPNGKKGKELEDCLALNSRYYEEIDREALAREPWFRFAKESWLSEKELDPQFVFPVVTLEEAVEKLNKTPVVELSSDEVFRLTQKKNQFKDRKPYLVRGLAINPSQGQFNVYQRQNAIFVLHQSIGSVSAQEEKRLPIVIWLTQKPEEIFVDCQIAEQ